MVKELKTYNPTKLSIHFNIDLYTPDSKWSNFTWGRIVGAIGVAGKSAPPFSVGRGRLMWSLDSTVQNAPFMVDSEAKK